MEDTSIAASSIQSRLVMKAISGVAGEDSSKEQRYNKRGFKKGDQPLILSYP
jgi:hypothetical protein